MLEFVFDCLNSKDGSIKKDIKITDTPNLVIPLTEQTVDVEIYKKPADTYNVINNDKKNIFKNITFLIDGRFDINKKKNLRLRGSSNQRVIDVNKSLNNNDIVIYKVG